MAAKEWIRPPSKASSAIAPDATKGRAGQWTKTRIEAGLLRIPAATEAVVWEAACEAVAA